MSILITILAVIIVLGVSVLVHELGHFWVARWLGVEADEFGIGFPPRLFAWKTKRTTISINAIPLGGFVRLAGEEEQTPHGFRSQVWWRKALIIIAGVVVNFVWGILLLSLAWATIGLPESAETARPGVHLSAVRVTVLAVAPASPAAEADLAPGDTIRMINTQEVQTTDQALTLIRESVGQPLSLLSCRKEVCATHTVTPRVNPPAGEGAMGVALATMGLGRYDVGPAVLRGITDSWSILTQTVAALGGVAQSLRQGHPGEVSLTGPIGIAVVTHDAVQLGGRYLLMLMAIISLNLALLNVLPIPALDGGRLVFVLVEAIRRKPIDDRLERWIHAAGFLFLLLVFLLISIKDTVVFRSLFVTLWERLRSIGR